MKFLESNGDLADFDFRYTLEGAPTPFTILPFTAPCPTGGFLMVNEFMSRGFARR